MSLIKYDSPVMELVSKTTDFILLNLLWVICSIPIVTFGAATTAKYTVAMRIIRREESKVFSGFFKAFKENFKQATIIWLILMVAVALCVLDWTWIRSKGDAVPDFYVIAIGIITVIVGGTIMSVFPFIARFTVTVKEAIKAAVIFTLLHFIQLALIVALEIGTYIASLWYFRWFPLIVLFGTTSAFYFNTIMQVKQFKKMEANLSFPEETESEDQIFHDANEDEGKDEQ